MRLTINTETNALIRALNFPEALTGPAGLNSIASKRGDTPTREIIFGIPFGAAVEIDATTPITSLKYGLKRAGDYAGPYLVSNWDGAAWAYVKSGGSRFTDAVLTSGSTQITSATAGFTAEDVGRTIAGAGIPSGTTIAAVTSATAAELFAEATSSGSGVTVTIAGRTPVYTVAPNYNTAGLNDALVDGEIAQTVADQAERLALTVAAGTIVKQADTDVSWLLVNAEAIADPAAWIPAPQKDFIDLAGEIELRQGDSITSTLTFTERVYNDVNKGTEGTPVELPDFQASQADAEAGTNNEKWMTPLRTAQAIAALGGGGGDPANSLTLPNGSKVEEGTTDAGLGGAKGVALKCSLSYEHKWEAGRLYTMEQDGFTIRRVEHCFNVAPTDTDDETKGFVVGSRWVLDDGTTYLCTSSTEGGALWQQIVVGGSDYTPSYELKNANFTAAAGKNYAVDAHPVAAVYPTFTYGGLVFTAKSPTSTATISWDNDGDLYGGGPNGFYIAGTETLGDIIDFINPGDFSFTVSLGAGAELTDSFPDDGYQEYTFSGGSAAGFVGVEATLPVNPAPGAVIGFADARGLWGTYPFTVRRSSGPLPAVLGASHKLIEGGTANFTNNAAGTFFSMVFIDNTTGWRVLSSGTKPLNLTAPTITGSYYFTATPGTWTGSPTSFAYQWQMSDDGETGWADIEGATASTYLAVEADNGKFVRVGVTATNSNGPSAVVYSAASSAIYVPDFPMSGLLAFWKLDNVNDSSGNGNTLTNNNTVTFGTGKIGNAAVLSGSNYLTRSGIVVGTSDVTISTWVKANENDRMVWTFRNNNGTVFVVTEQKFAIGDTFGTSAILTTDTISFGQWYHVVLTRSSGFVRIYVNGVENGSGWFETAFGNFPFTLGANGNGSEALTGSLDAVGIWDRALTTQEIAKLYNNGNGVEL